MFLKHIARSLKKSPIQPLVTVAVLTLAVATFIVSGKLALCAYDSIASRESEAYYLCDITVRPSRGDALGMVFLEDVLPHLAGEGDAIGEFSLSGMAKTAEGESALVSLSASPLREADGFYRLRFVSLGSISEESLKSSVILSTEAAEKYGLGLGDVLSVSLLGERFDLSVAGIALPYGPLSRAEGLIDISAVAAALARMNPAIAAAADSLSPYTAVHIRLSDPARVDAVADRLSSAEGLSDLLVIREAENIAGWRFYQTATMLLICIVSVIALLLSVLVIFTSLYILGRRRRRERALFMLCGAERRNLGKMLALEYGMYSFVGMMAGILLSVPFSAVASSSFSYEISFDGWSVVFALIAAPLTMLLGGMIAFLSEKKETVSELLSAPVRTRDAFASKKTLFLCMGAVIAFASAFLILPRSVRYVAGFCAIFSLATLLYKLVPTLLRVLCKGLSHLLEKCRRMPTVLWSAVKEMAASYPLLHAARLSAVLFSLMLLLSACFYSARAQAEVFGAMIDCDYMILGGTAAEDTALSEHPAVEESFRMQLLQDVVTEDGVAMLALSLDAEGLAYLHSDIGVSRLPEGEEIFISSGIAAHCEKKVGDTLVVNYETERYAFRVAGVFKAHANFVLFDAAHIGESRDILCVRSSAEEGSEALLSLMDTAQARGAYVQTREALFAEYFLRLGSYADLLLFLLCIGTAVTLVGICNILASARPERVHRQGILYSLGATRGRILRFRAAELSAVFAFAALLALVFGGAMLLLLDASMQSFGIDLVLL